MKKVLYTSKIREVEDRIDKAVVDYIDDGQIQTFESFSNFNILAFDWYDIYNPGSSRSQLMIYIDSDDILILCEDENAYQKANSIFKDAGTNERTLYEFFQTLLKGDSRYLEDLENKVSSAEDSILLNKSSSVQTIIKLRSEIRMLHGYYEQLDSIFESLVENENGLISAEYLKYFVILSSRTDRLLARVMNIMEYITHVREAYQAQIDIEQNKLMKIFTVLTSIFLPLTLLVGWYGMNFPMPEFSWRFGYPMVIALSIIICAVLLIIFKKKKLM